MEHERDRELLRDVRDPQQRRQDLLREHPEEADREPGEPPPASIWALGGLTPTELGKRVYVEFFADEVLDRAAALGFFFLMALFPLLLFLMALLGTVAEPGSQLHQNIYGYMQTVLPPTAWELVNSTITEVLGEGGGGKLTFGLLLTLWFASNGMLAVISGLNGAYGVRESRPIWKYRLTAIALTVAMTVLVISALLVVLFGGRIAEWLGAVFNMGQTFVSVWTVLLYPLAIGFVVFNFAVIYYFAPDVENQRWYWITPGSVVGVLLWLGASLGFRLYMQYFDNYSATYGSLGAAIALMLWLYITGICILLGGEINSEIEHAAAELGEPDAKSEGEKQAA